jgi:hypothetical protein
LNRKIVHRGNVYIIMSCSWFFGRVEWFIVNASLRYARGPDNIILIQGPRYIHTLYHIQHHQAWCLALE